MPLNLDACAFIVSDMPTITESARAYFERLLQDQPEGTGLRMLAVSPGTPAADCELNYWAPDMVNTDDAAVDCGGFVFYVDAASRPYLADAVIDFEHNETGGELTVKAPNLKGRRPDGDAPLEARVQWVLDARINPMVAQHGGRVALEGVTADNIAVLRFGGGCHGCGMIDVTLKQGVESTLKQEIPEIAGVRDATDHSTGTNPYY